MEQPDAVDRHPRCGAENRCLALARLSRPKAVSVELNSPIREYLYLCGQSHRACSEKNLGFLKLLRRTDLSKR